MLSLGEPPSASEQRLKPGHRARLQGHQRDPRCGCRSDSAPSPSRVPLRVPTVDLPDKTLLEHFKKEKLKHFKGLKFGKREEHKVLLIEMSLVGSERHYS